MEFRTLDWENFDECIKLQVSEDQDEFMADNIYSVAQAYVALFTEKHPPMVYAIYKDNKMVGFIMMYYETADENEDGENRYGILRFMIDKRYQGNGYGKEALIKAIDLIKSFPLGKAEIVYLSYGSNNEIARRLYQSVGFVETGEIVEDDELVAKLKI